MRWRWPWRRRTDPDTAVPDAPDAAVRARLRQVQLDLEERDGELRRAREELTREREHVGGRERESADTAVAGVVTAIGTPLAHLVTLAHLRDTGAADPRVGDVLGIGMRLVRALEDRDVRPCGAVGERAPYDPDRHEPMGDGHVEPGRAVVIRFVGFTHGARVLRKAGVELAEEEA